MGFVKKWKTNWELKSLTYEELFGVIVDVVTKQLDEEVKKQFKLHNSLIFLLKISSNLLVSFALDPS